MDEGEIKYENDLSEAKFDVAVDVGPTSDSKRQATVRAVTGMMQVVQDPETQSILASVALQNMKGEGLEDVRDYFRKRLVQAGAMKPNEEESAAMAAEAQNAGPDPQTQLMGAMAQEAEAKAAKARADTVLTVAQAEKTRAQTAETLASIDRDDRQELLKVADAMRQPTEQNPASAPPV